jgi:uncharacterized protein (DUF697 family)
LSALVLVVLKSIHLTGELSMPSTKQKVHDIIHAASFACSEADGESQAAEPDPVAIAPIQISMIIAIASAHGIGISDVEAAELLQTFSAPIQSGPVPVSRQAMTGWLPGIDKGTKDSKAAALTEAIGWTANSHFGQIEAKTKV